MKVLVTCPPMLGMIDSFLPLFNDSGIELTAPKVVQTMDIDKLIFALLQFSWARMDQQWKVSHNL